MQTRCAMPTRGDDSPKISVIMGILYRDRHLDKLKRSVYSIINQTFGDFELLICDNGSTSKAQDFLTELSDIDKRIRLIRSEERAILAAKLNACLKKAKGEYIARMDDDDYSMPDRFQKQYDLLKKRPDIAFVGCNVYLSCNGLGIREQKFPEFPEISDFYITQPFIHPTLLFRKKILNEIQGYSEDHSKELCEDYDLLLRLYEKGYRGINLQESLLEYTIPVDGKGNRKLHHRWNETITRWEHFKKLNQFPKALPFVMKPIITGLLPEPFLKKIKRYSVEPYTNIYIDYRPYRKSYLKTKEGQILVHVMHTRFSCPFQNYWEQFGYEIAGPVCYAYITWLSKLIDKNSKISDIVFVARDGWILEKIYNMLPHERQIKTHYIYATRSLTLQCIQTEKLEEYKSYLAEQDVGLGEVAVVDTVTMKFSSQRLIDMALTNKTIGFYWVILDSIDNYGENLDYQSYQEQHYHTIRCWNLMEFIMTSPEPPITAMNMGKPIFQLQSEAELEREKNFTKIESGALNFCKDIMNSGSYPEINNSFMTNWINDFLKNPNSDDKAAFQGVLFSEQQDHMNEIPLNPFVSHGYSLKEIKDLLWFYSQNHHRMRTIFKNGNKIRRNVEKKIKGCFIQKFDSKDLSKVTDQLEKFDIVSFDIFDTLILRPFNKPTDLFYVLEEKNKIDNFFKSRIQAEEIARRQFGSTGEVNIFEIYTYLAPKFGRDIKEMALEEIEIEKELCFANPEMIELYQLLKKKNVRMIAVSDMYIPSQYLREILEKCGFTSIEKLFVSCEYRAGKSGGALQRRVQTELGNFTYIHIGDNQESDVQGSISAGWKSILYKYHPEYNTGNKGESQK